jgi:MYXO-CTERM domain-containing protein
MRLRSLVVIPSIWVALAGAASADAPRLLTMPAPCPGPQCEMDAPLQPQAVGLRIVYLNFDGVTLTASSTNDDATNDRSGILSHAIPSGQTRTIAPLSVNDLASTNGLTRTQIISRVVSEMYASHAPYNIEFVTERPASGNYSMVVFGGSCNSVAGQSNCAGIALLDCGDYMPNNITFVFPNGLRVGDLASTAAQEEAHAFGLAHTTDTSDIMYPYLRTFIPTEFGAGPVPEGDSTCAGRTYQDSDELMLQIIGYRGQDTVGPTITITSPSEGQVVEVGTPIQADITDASDIEQAELLVNGVQVAEKTAAPWTFQVPEGTEPGEVTLTIRARDSMGNLSQSLVRVYLPSGDEETCSPGGDQCKGGLECSGGLCVPGDGIGGLGAACDVNEECETQICAESEGDKRCSQRCDAATPCPDGFECRGDVACWPTPESSGGCTAAGPASSPLALLWLLALVALAARRRR